MSASSRLPPELWDSIIDQLRDQPGALKACSIVSKSWTARSRKHIFSTVEFKGDLDIVAWQNVFADPSNSPAHHALTLIMNHRRGFPVNHLSSFCNVTRLFLHVHPVERCPAPLAQLYGFTPLLKSLHMTFPILPFNDVLGLVYSFPLLDDLLLTGMPLAPDAEFIPLTSPTFSGSLCLAVFMEMRAMVDHLLTLPGGIHFRELILPWICDKDMPSMMDLIYVCSGSLEILQVLNHTKQGTTLHPLDLSFAVYLKSIVFRCGAANLSVDWITAAVESIKSSHLKEITLHMPGDITARENAETQLSTAVYAQWMALDGVLVKYLTTRSFKLKVIAASETDRDAFEARVEHLLPVLFAKKMLEVTTRIVRG